MIIDDAHVLTHPDVLEGLDSWAAAGVRLSAMRMEGTDYPADFVSELALDPGSIGEYLVDEVLPATRTAATAARRRPG